MHNVQRPCGCEDDEFLYEQTFASVAPHRLLPQIMNGAHHQLTAVLALDPKATRDLELVDEPHSMGAHVQLSNTPNHVSLPWDVDLLGTWVCHQVTAYRASLVGFGDAPEYGALAMKLKSAPKEIRGVEHRRYVTHNTKSVPCSTRKA
eukprot:4359337-Amphidinium_carterae.1